MVSTSHRKYSPLFKKEMVNIQSVYLKMLAFIMLLLMVMLLMMLSVLTSLFSVLTSPNTSVRKVLLHGTYSYPVAESPTTNRNIGHFPLRSSCLFLFLIMTWFARITIQPHKLSMRYSNHPTLREESSQTNVILQYKLLASILGTVCSVIQQS